MATKPIRPMGPRTVASGVKPGDGVTPRGPRPMPGQPAPRPRNPLGGGPNPDPRPRNPNAATPNPKGNAYGLRDRTALIAKRVGNRLERFKSKHPGASEQRIAQFTERANQKVTTKTYANQLRNRLSKAGGKSILGGTKPKPKTLGGRPGMGPYGK